MCSRQFIYETQRSQRMKFPFLERENFLLCAPLHASLAFLFYFSCRTLSLFLMWGHVENHDLPSHCAHGSQCIRRTKTLFFTTLAAVYCVPEYLVQSYGKSNESCKHRLKYLNVVMITAFQELLIQSRWCQPLVLSSFFPPRHILNARSEGRQFSVLRWKS